MMEIPRSIDIRYFQNPTMQQGDDKQWKPARPLPFYSIFERWLRAFDVLIGRADALYWDRK